jgi:hypothetical protein
MTVPALCAACGYVEATHPDGRCPVCVCGEVIDLHPWIPDGPMVLLTFAEGGRFTRPCPGKSTQLRHGKFRLPSQSDPAGYAEIMRRDAAARFAADDEARLALEPPAVVPPQVPARPPVGPGELAGYGGKQAIGLGRTAVAAEWSVTALYWRSGAGVEGCGIWLAKGPVRAVATWKRAAGKQGAKSGWGADLAYAWRADVPRFPSRLNHTDLERLIK